MEKNFTGRLSLLFLTRFKKNKADFARATEISTSTMGSYLGGHTYPRVPEIERIARVCGVSIHWLFTGEELPSWFGGLSESGGDYRAGEKKNCNPFLTQIIGWIDEIFGENSPQSVIFYNDLLQRYPSFAEYVQRTTPPPETPAVKKDDCQVVGE